MGQFSGLAVCSLIAAAGATGAETWWKDDALVTPVEHKAHEAQPTERSAASTRLSILAAEARAKEMGRRLFLFSYDGKIETGRC